MDSRYHAIKPFLRILLRYPFKFQLPFCLRKNNYPVRRKRQPAVIQRATSLPHTGFGSWFIILQKPPMLTNRTLSLLVHSLGVIFGSATDNNCYGGCDLRIFKNNRDTDNPKYSTLFPRQQRRRTFILLLLVPEITGKWIIHYSLFTEFNIFRLSYLWWIRVVWVTEILGKFVLCSKVNFKSRPLFKWLNFLRCPFVPRIVILGTHGIIQDFCIHIKTSLSPTLACISQVDGDVSISNSFRRLFILN